MGDQQLVIRRFERVRAAHAGAPVEAGLLSRSVVKYGARARVAGCPRPAQPGLADGLARSQHCQERDAIHAVAADFGNR